MSGSQETAAGQTSQHPHSFEEMHLAGQKTGKGCGRAMGIPLREERRREVVEEV